MMRDRVATTYPAHGLLGEEFKSVNLNSPDIWVVDPIDGTRSFVTGWPMWRTLVAKLTQGTPDIGVIDMPALNERWVGVCGKYCIFTSAKKQQNCRVSSCSRLEQAKFYTTNIQYFQDADRPKIDKLLKLTRHSGKRVIAAATLALHSQALQFLR